MKAVKTIPATALPAQIEPSRDDFATSGLRVFSSVPRHHDVATLLGMVVIFDPDTLCREGIVDGSLYVVENQHPVGGMSWETYDRFNREHGPRDLRVRINTNRRVIRAVKRENAQNQWWQVSPSGFHDGLYPDWSVAHNMVGKVVGVYLPSNDGGAS